jgi:hypothetical protein
VYVEPFPNDLSKLLAAESLFYLSFISYVYAPSAMHAVMHAVMNSASLGAVATYGLVSDQSPSAFLEVRGPARFSEKAIILYFD